MDLLLPEKLREKLKKPFGRTYPDIESAKKTLINSYIISVGDEVTQKLLSNGIEPNICIYDKKTQRKKITLPEEIKNYAAEEKKAVNPAGKITQEAADTIKEAIKGGRKTKIFITGEEDLLALPAITAAPEDALIIYGQPNKGLVVVKADSKTKQKAKKIMDEMIEDENTN